MKDMKKILAGVMAMSMVVGMTACGGTDEAADETTAEVTTTTTATVAINTATLNDDDQATLDQVAEQLIDVELENKTIKWIAHYDLNPSTSGQSESVALNLFKSKYEGNIEWYPTTWETRYNDLSTYILGGEGIDFFPCDTAALPKGVISGMFQPVDDYIDMSSDLWKEYASAMEIYNFAGKHYEFVTNVTAEQVVIYNKKTIEENGLEDPYEQWKAGEWNWDTFKESLMQYVDPDNDCYGLDGFWAEKALYLSAGVPAVSSVDGTLTCNLMNEDLEKAMNFGYDLYNNNLIINREIFDWAEQPQFMGEGKELFYICGAWAVNTDPATWTTKIDPADLGLVPVPSPAGSPNYQAATLDGWCLCKGASNPDGVARFAECTILANKDEAAIAIGDQKLRDDAHWSDELIQINKEINDIARQYPVVDLATGVSTDVASLTTDGGDNVGLRGAFHGVDWATNRDEISSVVSMLVDEADQQIKDLG
ncbi:MAG: extracellular solute-binding protein [Oscillospiraceae bacterium]|nr:extracellular solute-binding protein [Oscillospiraceae bacterium]